MALPVTTLFMLMSVDGKISTGVGDHRDFDRDLPQVPGIAEGLGQYYQLEQRSGRFSLNTGRVLTKVGWNEEKSDIERLPASFVVVDNQHLTQRGVSNLLRRTSRLIVVTNNLQHPVHQIRDRRLQVLTVNGELDFHRVFSELGALGVQDLTVQSGGQLNATLARSGLLHYLSIVVAPLLVGGRTTPTLLDGEPLSGDADLALLRPLELIHAETLEASYLHLRYAVSQPPNDSTTPPRGRGQG